VRAREGAPRGLLVLGLLGLELDLLVLAGLGFEFALLVVEFGLLAALRCLGGPRCVGCGGLEGGEHRLGYRNHHLGVGGGGKALGGRVG
jgi:hypothetical protein